MYKGNNSDTITEKLINLLSKTKNNFDFIETLSRTELSNENRK